eukprot:NODE_3801_length_403_cov_106.415254_g3363_i0.p1 GENE.NODE_3801_length_403_cov_106.415254_g3363_i0~~NODE_3801_length_403_cov_106.415254_g3363_i0.p1  ORF type:complete len:110 (-),score=22.64 NODE_3801_length_403_cov_106.415254_g3363_i0:41-370(-)
MGERAATAAEKKRRRELKDRLKLGQESASPNNVLFVENLPIEPGTDTHGMVTMLFTTFQGFREVRLVPGEKGYAFVEFDNELAASTAMASLQGFKITPANQLKIAYAKK